MLKKLIEIIWLIVWAIAEVDFDSLPHFLQLGIAKKKCSAAAQYVKRYMNPEDGFVYLAEVLNDPHHLSDHLMNVDHLTGEFYDFYGNRIPGVEIGYECSFRKGHRYVVIAFASDWKEFGWVSLEHSLKECRELNQWLYRTRK